MRLAVLIFYSLLATGLLPALLDAAITIEHPVRAKSNADFPCAGHGCGCEESSCREHCCCFPAGEKERDSKPRGDSRNLLSLMLVSRCAGDVPGTLMERELTPPHLSIEIGERVWTPRLQETRDRLLSSHDEPDLDPPTHIPRAAFSKA